MKEYIIIFIFFIGCLQAKQNFGNIIVDEVTSVYD